jgi:hypothetical protein
MRSVVEQVVVIGGPPEGVEGGIDYAESVSSAPPEPPNPRPHEGVKSLPPSAVIRGSPFEPFRASFGGTFRARYVPFDVFVGVTGGVVRIARLEQPAATR